MIHIESHGDDSVTLKVGSITAHIRGGSWRDANDAAWILGTHIAGRAELAEVRSRIRSMRSIAEDLEKILRAAERQAGSLRDEAAELAASAVPAPCDHGITFDEDAARGLGPREVRLRWPRGHFTAEHPCLKCGVDNLIHYASRAHYIAGDW